MNSQIIRKSKNREKKVIQKFQNLHYRSHSGNVIETERTLVQIILAIITVWSYGLIEACKLCLQTGTFFSLSLAKLRYNVG